MRRLFLAFAVLEALAPDRVVRLGERLAFENPGVGRLRRWTLPMARLEGLAFCWLAYRGGTRSRAAAGLLAGSGIAACLAPNRVVEWSLTVAYENPDDLEVKPWVVPATRALGAGYVVLALFVGRANTPADSSRGPSR